MKGEVHGILCRYYLALTQQSVERSIMYGVSLSLAEDLAGHGRRRRRHVRYRTVLLLCIYIDIRGPIRIHIRLSVIPLWITHSQERERQSPKRPLQKNKASNGQKNTWNTNKLSTTATVPSLDCNFVITRQECHAMSCTSAYCACW